MTRRCVNAVLGVSSALVFNIVALADQPKALSLMLPNQATPQAIRAIAAIGQPTMLDIAKDERLADDVLRRCGTLDPVYVAELLDRNKTLVFDDLRKMQRGTRVEFPACARAPVDDLVANVFQDGLAAENKPWPVKWIFTTDAGIKPDSASSFTTVGDFEWQNNYASLFAPSTIRKPTDTEFMLSYQPNIRLDPENGRWSAKWDFTTDTGIKPDSASPFTTVGDFERQNNYASLFAPSTISNPTDTEFTLSYPPNILLDTENRRWSAKRDFTTDTGIKPDSASPFTTVGDSEWHLFAPSTTRRPTDTSSEFKLSYPPHLRLDDTNEPRTVPGILAALKIATDQIKETKFQPQTLSNTVGEFYRSVAALQVAPARADTVGVHRKPTPLWSSISLRPDEDPSIANARLDAALRLATDPSGNVEPGPTSASNVPSTAGDTTFAELVDSVDDTDANIVGYCSGKEVTDKVWPFDLFEILRVIALNSRMPKHNQREPARVLVADSGFDGGIRNSDRFHDDSLLWLKALPPRRGRGWQGGSDEVVGNNLATWEDDPATPAGLGASRFHGLEVGGAALGGRVLEDLRGRGAPSSDEQRLVKVAYVSLMDATPRIKSASIANTYQVASDNGISVINLSLTMLDKPFEFITPMTQFNGNVMLVVSAGNEVHHTADLEASRNNDSVDLDAHPRWPAMFGGAFSNAAGGAVVITVGAHDARNAISPFSFRSAMHVDLLAPGCKIPTYSAEVQGKTLQVYPVNMSGTSFAAPLVSFVAAILVREGLSVAQVKSRLIVSVDEKADLDDKVYSSGVLNAWRALAVHHDVVTYRDGSQSGEEIKTIIGHVLPGRRTVQLCGKPIRLDWLRKLVLKPTSVAGTLLVSGWHTDASGSPLVREKPCSTQAGDELSPTILVVDSETGQKLPISIGEIRDWTPSFYSWSAAQNGKE